MENFILYLLKVNGLMIFFWIFYKLFLQKETFYELNRWYFIITLLSSFVLPLIYFTKVEEIILNPTVNQTFIPTQAFINEPFPVLKWYEQINYGLVVLIGIATVSFFKVVHRMYKIYKMVRSIKQMPIYENQENIRLSLTDKNTYSFYKWIVLPKEALKHENVRYLLEHETLHLTQKHTFDLVSFSFLIDFFWFNPLLKLVRSDVNLNLEFLVDAEMTKRMNSYTYQKSLLNYSQNINTNELVNGFNSSDLKKRILQLNTQKSNNMKKLKFLLATPALISFFALFQIETVAQIKEVKSVETNKPHETNQEVNESADRVGSIHIMQESDKQKDYFMLLETVQKDLELLKNDRKTFDKIASKFPIYVDGSLMTKKQLKKFDTTKIRSAHIDSGNPKDGTILKVSTKQTEQENLRTFTFNTASFESIKIHGKEATQEELIKHIDKINQQKQDSVLTSNHIQIQKINDDEKRITVTGKGIGSPQKIVYIVDGKEINVEDFSKIHPSQIERIDVLKDKKSIEKYGDKSKDGVLLITTKTNKEISLHERKKALKTRELALQKTKQATQERKIQISKLKETREKQRQELLAKKDALQNKSEQRKKEIEKVIQEKEQLKKNHKYVTVSNKGDRKRLEKDYETVNGIFKDLKSDVKKLEDDNFKITSMSASLTREDGTKIEIAENY